MGSLASFSVGKGSRVNVEVYTPRKKGGDGPTAEREQAGGGREQRASVKGLHHLSKEPPGWWPSDGNRVGTSVELMERGQWSGWSPRESRQDSSHSRGSGDGHGRQAGGRGE